MEIKLQTIIRKNKQIVPPSLLQHLPSQVPQLTQEGRGTWLTLAQHVWPLWHLWYLLHLVFIIRNNQCLGLFSVCHYSNWLKVSGSRSMNSSPIELPPWPLSSWWCKQQSRMQLWWWWLLQSEHSKLGHLLWYLWMPWVHNYTYSSNNNKQTNAIMSKSRDWWSG